MWQTPTPEPLQRSNGVIQTRNFELCGFLAHIHQPLRQRKKGKTVFTTEQGFGVVVVRDIPATISQCGADWIEDTIASKREEIVDNARQKPSRAGAACRLRLNLVARGFIPHLVCIPTHCRP